MPNFELGQIVKQNYGAVAHYAIILSESQTVGWVNSSILELKPIEDQGWEVVKVKGEILDFETIKKNIKSFKDALAAGKARKYHVTEFNCEHWATLMVTGKSYSTQSGGLKFGTAEIVGGAMVGVGASAGTAVTIAATLGATASTGTAIGSLSGAAATNAALAWLGGGTLAAGGGGVAAGTAIVSAVSTGGAVVAIAGVGIISKKVWDNLNESQRQFVITKIGNSTPEQVKVVYGTTADKATKLLNSACSWLGNTTATVPQTIQAALKNTTESGLNKSQALLQGTQKTGQAAWQKISKTTNRASGWVKGLKKRNISTD